MPRVFDYTKSDPENRTFTFFPTPVFGKGEMKDNEFENFIRPLSHFGRPMIYVFSNKLRLVSSAASSRLDGAHTWLSENTTGPWYWQEAIGNAGHQVVTSLYIERRCDQLAFSKGPHHTLFVYNPTFVHSTIAAALRGAVSPQVLGSVTCNSVPPDDFAAYLKGERADYETPFLQNILPLRVLGKGKVPATQNAL